LPGFYSRQRQTGFLCSSVHTGSRAHPTLSPEVKRPESEAYHSPPYVIESDSELLYDWRFTAKQLVLATSPTRLTTNNFIFQLNTCGYSPYVTFSPTRGWVCLLRLLLVFASAVILMFESRGTHDHPPLSQIRDFPNLEDQVPVFISPWNRVTQLYPQALSSLFVASYDPQGYGGGIRPRLHTVLII
jgi:hypothetical protein